MPMSFPDMKSLKSRAAIRGFRQPNEGESEATYRSAFADFMLDVDRVESAEIRNKVGWDQQDPLVLLVAAMHSSPVPAESEPEPEELEREFKAFTIGFHVGPETPEQFKFPDLNEPIPKYKLAHLVVDAHDSAHIYDNDTGTEWVAVSDNTYKRTVPAHNFLAYPEVQAKSNTGRGVPMAYTSFDLLAYFKELMKFTDNQEVRTHLAEINMRLYIYYDHTVTHDGDDFKYIKDAEVESLIDQNSTMFVNLCNVTPPRGRPSHIKGGLERVVRLSVVLKDTMYVDDRSLFWLAQADNKFVLLSNKGAEPYVLLADTLCILKEFVDTTPVISSPARKLRAADATNRMMELQSLLHKQFQTCVGFEGTTVKFIQDVK